MINIIIEEVNKNYQYTNENFQNNMMLIDASNLSLKEYIQKSNYKVPDSKTLLYLSNHMPDLINDYLRLIREYS